MCLTSARPQVTRKDGRKRKTYRGKKERHRRKGETERRERQTEKKGSRKAI